MASERQNLEELKEKVSEIQEELVNIIGAKFDAIHELIDERLDELELDDEDEDQEDYEEEESDEEEINEEDGEEEYLSIQQRLDAALLSQNIATQLQSVGEEPVVEVEVEAEPVAIDFTSEPVVVEVKQSSLSDLIKNQVEAVNEEVVVPVLSLTEQIANQVSVKDNLTVVAPGLSDGPVEIPAPVAPAPRPLGAIIQELRESVEVDVDYASERETDQMVERMTSSPDIDSDYSEDLAHKIRTQLVSNEIKKQLS